MFYMFIIILLIIAFAGEVSLIGQEKSVKGYIIEDLIFKIDRIYVCKATYLYDNFGNEIEFSSFNILNNLETKIKYIYSK